MNTGLRKFSKSNIHLREDLLSVGSCETPVGVLCSNPYIKNQLDPR